MHACMRTYMHACIHAYTHSVLPWNKPTSFILAPGEVYIHTYIDDIYMHTYTHTYIHSVLLFILVVMWNKPTSTLDPSEVHLHKLMDDISCMHACIHTYVHTTYIEGYYLPPTARRACRASRRPRHGTNQPPSFFRLARYT